MSSTSDPLFSRGEVAKILNITTLTVSNREKRKQYPEPDRDLNGYRVYTLDDVLRLQYITYSRLDTRPVMGILYDKGMRDMKLLGKIMDEAMARTQEAIDRKNFNQHG